jgi:hypothetical protein
MPHRAFSKLMITVLTMTWIVVALLLLAGALR